GRIIPFSIVNGLVHLKMKHFTEEEYETLKHVIMTSDAPWDPSKYDGELSKEAIQQEMETLSEQDPHEAPTLFVHNTTCERRRALIADQWPDHLSFATEPDSSIEVQMLVLNQETRHWEAC